MAFLRFLNLKDVSPKTTGTFLHPRFQCSQTIERCGLGLAVAVLRRIGGVCGKCARTARGFRSVVAGRVQAREPVVDAVAAALRGGLLHVGVSGREEDSTALRRWRSGSAFPVGDVLIARELCCGGTVCTVELIVSSRSMRSMRSRDAGGPPAPSASVVPAFACSSLRFVRFGSSRHSRPVLLSFSGDRPMLQPVRVRVRPGVIGESSMRLDRAADAPPVVRASRGGRDDFGSSACRRALLPLVAGHNPIDERLSRIRSLFRADPRRGAAPMRFYVRGSADLARGAVARRLEANHRRWTQAGASVPRSCE